MGTTVICFLAAGLITAVNVVISLISIKQAKAVIAWQEAAHSKGI